MVLYENNTKRQEMQISVKKALEFLIEIQRERESIDDLLNKISQLRNKIRKMEAEEELRRASTTKINLLRGEEEEDDDDNLRV